ncbi:MAG: hypothetical protein QY319_05025 [Candidatus Kapaibacterium sp.]|nr:MAG: hypothetical protein QY319_05025 [Candidatus Kapabacteria bacterium]
MRHIASLVDVFSSANANQCDNKIVQLLMNPDELVADKYLRQIFGDVKYEPRGPSTAPDFLCDNRVAVEVRRIADLTSVAGKEVESHTLHMRLIRVTKGILLALCEDHTLRANSNYCVWVRMYEDRQVNKKAWLARLRQHLPYCIAGDIEGDGFEIEVCSGVTFAFGPVSYGEQTYFFKGIEDFNSGGVVAGSYVRSISRAITEKATKQIHYRKLYSEHWLLLVDRLMDLHIGSREDFSDLEIVRRGLTRPDLWDRVVVINPKDMSTLLEY